jgi:dTDP-4-amino-4,6-dideoxygalactose transaminase
MKIPATKIHFSADDRKEILSRIDCCLETGQVSQGANVDELEALFAQYVGCQHALALSSGGSSLEAAMRALGVEGKEVLVPTNTFLATAAGVLAAGGSVRLLDIDLTTISPSVQIIEEAIGPQTVGVIVVHIGGIISRDIEQIRVLCDQKGVWLFEDCAHAHGSEFAGKKAGCFGVGGAYSFFSTKVMTCGEGGMFVTSDYGVAKEVALLRNYGKADKWVTICERFGLNWRLNELAAAVAVVQLKRLDEFVDYRTRVAQHYTKILADEPRVTILQPSGRCSWYKYIVLLPTSVNRDELKKYAAARGVTFAGGVYDRPLHSQPVATSLGFSGTFPKAVDFCARHVCLPIYVGMTSSETDYVVEVFRDALDFV